MTMTHLLDEGEFAEHAVQMRYPEKIRQAARATADALVAAITDCRVASRRRDDA